MSPETRAELIGGIVYMSSPQKMPRGRFQHLLSRWIGEYEEATPGTEALLNSTNILGRESEPEPDACLLVLPECRGQTWENKEHYLCGAPELVAEVAWATESPIT